MNWFRRVALWSLIALSAADAGELREEPKLLFEWFSALGYPEIKEAEWVEANIGRGYRQPDGRMVLPTVQGFLIEDKSDCFRVAQSDLSESVLFKSAVSEGELRWVGYKKRSFQEMVAARLDELRNPPKAGVPPRYSCLGQTAEVFYLAYCCWRKGDDGMADALYREAVKLPVRDDLRGERLEPMPDMRKVLEMELGRAAMDRVMVEIGLRFNPSEKLLPTIPRTALLESMRRIVRNFPASAFHAAAVKHVAMLERLCAEDAAHRSPVPEELAKLPLDQQIDEWIFRLRDQMGIIEVDGRNSFFTGFDGKDVPVAQLMRIGYPAVPKLIEAIGDERYARGVDHLVRWNGFWKVKTISECALQLLDRITGETFPRSSAGGEGRLTAEQRKELQKAPLEWWREFQEKGEKQILIDGIVSGKKTLSPLVLKLAAIAPESVEAAVLEGAVRAVEAHWGGEYVSEVGKLHSEAATELLLGWMNGAKTVFDRLQAATFLHERDHPSVRQAMLKEWRVQSIGGDDGSRQTMELLVDLLIADGSKEAMAALLRDMSKGTEQDRLCLIQRLGCRLGLPDDPFPYNSIKTRSTDADAKELAVEWLVNSLSDRSSLFAINGNWLGLDYSKARICDFSLWALSRIDSKRFKFHPAQGWSSLERDRIEAINLWRKERGLVRLPESDPVLNARKLEGNDSLRIVAVDVFPAGLISDASLAERLSKLEGTDLTPTTLSGLMKSYSSQACRGVAGLRIRAIREEKGSGVVMVVGVKEGTYSQSMILEQNGQAGSKVMPPPSGVFLPLSTNGEAPWSAMSRFHRDVLAEAGEGPFQIQATLLVTP